jgi:hypothetical protein
MIVPVSRCDQHRTATNQHQAFECILRQPLLLFGAAHDHEIAVSGMECQALQRIAGLFAIGGSYVLLSGRRIADIDLPAHAEIAEIAGGDLRKRLCLGVELFQCIAQPGAARKFGARVARSLSRTDEDM